VTATRNLGVLALRQGDLQEARRRLEAAAAVGDAESAARLAQLPE
jgi:hypothetical protein